MKLALDPQMYFSTSTVYELPDHVARLGYEWMELSPKADFIPFFRYPRVDDAGVRRLRKVAADAGVGIASVLPVQRWSGPDEDQRQAAHASPSAARSPAWCSVTSASTTSSSASPDRTSGSL